MEERELSFRPLPFVLPAQGAPALTAQPSVGFGAYPDLLREKYIPSRKTEKQRSDFIDLVG